MGCTLANSAVIPASGKSVPESLVKKDDGTIPTTRNTANEVRTTESEDSLNIRVPSAPSSPRSPRTQRLKHNEFILMVKNNSMTSANAFFYVNKNPQCLFVADKDGKTVIDYAAANGNTNLVTLFRKKQLQCTLSYPVSA